MKLSQEPVGFAVATVSILATLIVLFLAWDTPAKIPANEPGASARSAAISFYSRLR